MLLLHKYGLWTIHSRDSTLCILQRKVQSPSAREINHPASVT